MRAARIHRFGPPSAIVVEDIAPDAPGDGEVLVRVAAAGVGPWDSLVRTGASALKQPLPFTIGAEISGVVESAGAGVTRIRPGDEVYGATNDLFIGASCEYAVASAAKVARKPHTLTHLEAASVPVVAVTAHQLLVDRAKVAAGQTVLVLGASGNVGRYAVQIAHGKGARVIAAAATDDPVLLERLGADTTLDLRKTPFEEVAKDVDVVIDTVGGELEMRSLAVVRRGGIVVSAVSPPDAEEARRRGIRAEYILVNVTTASLEELATMFDGGVLASNAVIDLPLGQAVRAHEMLEMRPRPEGKIVLRIPGEETSVPP